MMDIEDGYPTDDALQRIREWPWEDGFRGLMAHIRSYWEGYGSWDQRGDRFRLATGGWSGNEDIVDALDNNWMFQSLCAVSWHKGGLYIYDVQNWDDNPERGNRHLIRDPETPLDGSFVLGCDHIAA